MKLSLIYAQLENGSIGYAGPEPMAWNIPEDLRHFKDLTIGTGKSMIMGSNTFDSLPRLLPGRFHYVLTKRKGLHRLGRLDMVQFVPSVDEAVRLATERGDTELIGIGGGDVLFQLVGEANMVHRTVIRDIVLDESRLQVTAPDLERYDFTLVEEHPAQTCNAVFQTWVRQEDEE